MAQHRRGHANPELLHRLEHAKMDTDEPASLPAM